MKSKGMESEEIHGRILFTLDNFMKKIQNTRFANRTVRVEKAKKQR